MELNDINHINECMDECPSGASKLKNKLIYNKFVALNETLNACLACHTDCAPEMCLE